MKLFEILLSSYDQTIAIVAGAETLERAEELVREEYDIVEDEDENLHIYRSSEIWNGSTNEEFVKEIFNTNEL